MKIDLIQKQIYTIRGVQVMLDRDISAIFDVETRVLNQAVKRNLARFPAEFMFQMTRGEHDCIASQNVSSDACKSLRSQIVTSNQRGGRRYLPYVFTEQGVAMLSAVLRSRTAVKTSIQVIKAFVAMRRFIASNAQIFHRLDAVERKQLEHKCESDENFKKLFNAIAAKDVTIKQGIFFNGQIFYAYRFISDLFRTATKSIIIIDNYVDDSVLIHLAKRQEGVKVTILTRSVSRLLTLDIMKFNEQYPAIEIREFNNSHDRFVIIDGKTVYHLGASLKDLGRKWFAFSKMEVGALEMLARVEAECPIRAP